MFLLVNDSFLEVLQHLLKIGLTICLMYLGLFLDIIQAFLFLHTSDIMSYHLILISLLCPGTHTVGRMDVEGKMKRDVTFWGGCGMCPRESG